MNETELVLKSKKGDIDSFCKLYDIYKKRLYNYACFKLNNLEDAEDAVQESILIAFEQIHKLISPKAFSAWIFKILHCECCKYIKTQISQRNTDNIENYKNTISYYSESAFWREEIREALSILKEREKSIVLLAVIAGFNSKEISQITGDKPGNIRQILRRSLAKMKEYLS